MGNPILGDSQPMDLYWLNRHIACSTDHYYRDIFLQDNHIDTGCLQNSVRNWEIAIAQKSPCHWLTVQGLKIPNPHCVIEKRGGLVIQDQQLGCGFSQMRCVIHPLPNMTCLHQFVYFHNSAMGMQWAFHLGLLKDSPKDFHSDLPTDFCLGWR